MVGRNAHNEASQQVMSSTMKTSVASVTLLNASERVSDVFVDILEARRWYRCQRLV